MQAGPDRAVLADGLACALDRTTSHPTLPRPTLPDQIYEGESSSEEYNISFISPLHAHADTTHRIADVPETTPRPPPSFRIARPRPRAFTPAKHHHHHHGLRSARLHQETGIRSGLACLRTFLPIHMTIAVQRPSRTLQASLFLDLKSRSSTALKTTIL